jgi:hypothetical protein
MQAETAMPSGTNRPSRRVAWSDFAPVHPPDGRETSRFPYKGIAFRHVVTNAITIRSIAKLGVRKLSAVIGVVVAVRDRDVAKSSLWSGWRRGIGCSPDLGALVGDEETVHFT